MWLGVIVCVLGGGERERGAHIGCMLVYKAQTHLTFYQVNSEV